LEKHFLTYETPVNATFSTSGYFSYAEKINSSVLVRKGPHAQLIKSRCERINSTLAVHFVPDIIYQRQMQRKLISQFYCVRDRTHNLLNPDANKINFALAARKVPDKNNLDAKTSFSLKLSTD
jgi:hypothetical protein